MERYMEQVIFKYLRAEPEDHYFLLVGLRVKVMMFNATFNNISAISWWSVLLAEETGENHWQNLSHNVVSLCDQIGYVQLSVAISWAKCQVILIIL